MSRNSLSSKRLLAEVGDLAVELHKSSLVDPRFAAGRPGDYAALLTRLHTNYHALCVKACNVPVDEEDIKRYERRLLRRLTQAGFPANVVRLGGDPRGCVMFLKLPSQPTRDLEEDGFSYRVPRERGH